MVLTTQAIYQSGDFGLAFRVLARVLNFYTLPRDGVNGQVVFKVGWGGLSQGFLECITVTALVIE